MPETNYFKIINDLKEQFELKYQHEPTHLIVGIETYYDIESSESLLSRLLYIKDTTQGVLGTQMLSLRVIKSNNFKGMKVGLLY